MRKAVRIGVVVLLWTPIFTLVGHVASGIGPAELPGFNLGAKANAMQWAFESPSLGIPAEPTGELDFAHTEITLKSGPVAYALGSVLWPGQVAAALPSFLQGEIENSSNGQFKSPFAFPNYPIRAESFYPQGPTTQSTQAGTLVMDSAASGDASNASASYNRIGLPGIFTVGSQSSLATNGFDSDGVVSMVHAAANDISFLSGALKIESVTSSITARSDGDHGTVAGTTTVQGATVAGHGVTIDSKGVHVEGQGIATAAAQQAVNAVLKNAGISVELASPKDTITGAAAARSLPGLIVKLNDFALASFTGGSFTPDQEMWVTLAPAQANAGAAKAFTFPTDTGTVGSVTPPVSGSSPTTITETTRESVPSGSSGSPSVAAPVVGGTTLAAAPRLKDFRGIPVAIFVGLLLIAFATSRPLMAAADRLLFGRGSSACPEGKD